MASTYELRTFLDIVTAVAEELKIQSTDTTSLNRIRRDINIVYQDEILPFAEWKWLRDAVNLTLPAKITAGTATVTSNSKTVTLTSAPGINMTGAWFSIEGYNERYKVDYHTANSTSLILDSVFTGSTLSAQSYLLWRDALPLPADCTETFKVTHDFLSEPLDNVGLQKYRDLVSTSPRAEGRPQVYTTSDYKDPSPYAAVSGLPASASIASSALVKTITFASDVSSYLSAGDRICVKGANDDFNGEYVIATVATTAITYTGRTNANLSTTVNTGVTVLKLTTQTDVEKYRELLIHPSIFNQQVTLHVDYIKEVSSLINDTDEPVIPLKDRSVLLYGALARAWSRERNPEEASRNQALCDRKLAKMAGKVDDSTDSAVLRPAKSYLSTKRKGYRFRGDGYANSGFLGGMSGAQSVTGISNTVAVFGSDGQLIGSTLISTTELNQLDGVSSSVRGISDTATLTNKTIDAGSNTITNLANANISSVAAIAYTKLALSNSIVNADINSAAAIAYSKLNLAGSIVNADVATGAAIAYSKLALSGSIVNADIASGAAIVDSKLATIATAGKVSNSATTATSANTNSAIVARDGSGNFSAGTITAALSGNATTATSATTATTATNFSGSLSGDVTGTQGATAITGLARTKLSAGTANAVCINDGSGFITSEAALSPVRGGTGVANNAAATLTRSGNHAVTLTTTNTTSLTLPTTGTLAVTTTQSRVRVETGNGHGSTNTKIRRYTTSVVNTGSGITYADSATNGASFTINEAGLYAISCADRYSNASGAANFGISLNTAAPTTSILTITNTERLAISQTGPAASVASQICTVIQLAVNDVIRPHDDGLPDDTGVRSYFEISKVGQ